MPQADPKLMKKYRFTTWTALELAAPQRKKGYLEAAKKLVADEKDGVVYFTEKNWNLLAREFRIAGLPVEPKKNRSRNNTNRVFGTHLRKFLTGHVHEYPKEVKQLRSNYIKELEGLGENCPRCKQTALDRKYSALLMTALRDTKFDPND